MTWSVGSEQREIQLRPDRSIKGQVPFLFDPDGNEIRRTGSFDDVVFICFRVKSLTEVLLPELKFEISSESKVGRFMVGISDFASSAASAGLTRERTDVLLKWIAIRLSEAIRILPELFVPSMKVASHEMEIVFEALPTGPWEVNKYPTDQERATSRLGKT